MEPRLCDFEAQVSGLENDLLRSGLGFCHSFKIRLGLGLRKQQPKSNPEKLLLVARLSFTGSRFFSTAHVGISVHPYFLKVPSSQPCLHAAAIGCPHSLSPVHPPLPPFHLPHGLLLAEMREEEAVALLFGEASKQGRV